jgi:hypothetical protein
VAETMIKARNLPIQIQILPLPAKIVLAIPVAICDGFNQQMFLNRHLHLSL